MKTNAIALLSLFYCFNAVAQKSEKKFYFVTKEDTVYCKQLKFNTNMQGYLNDLEYTDMQGKVVKIKGKSDVPDVSTFYVNGIIYDKIPLKADKPDGYIRYTQRAVDGKLKVYLAQQGYNTAWQYAPRWTPSSSPVPVPAASSHDFSMGGPVGIYRFYIEMPDGTFYKINDKDNLKNHIKPFLLKCKEFEDQYKGDFSTKEEPFMKMINLYNSVCD